MTMPTPDELLMSSGSKSASFLTVGTRVSGTILTKPKVQVQTDIKSGAVLKFQSGDPRLQLVITLQTDQRENEDDDGVRAVYAKSNMLKAIKEAVIAAEANGLDPGGQLSIVYSGDGEATQKGFDPPKLYQAHYRPPADQAVSDALGLPPAGAAPPPPPTAPPPAATVSAPPASAPPPNGQMPPPPRGIDPAVWAAFTPEQRAALAPPPPPVPAQQPAPTGIDPTLWANLTPDQQALLTGANPPF